MHINMGMRNALLFSRATPQNVCKFPGGGDEIGRVERFVYGATLLRSKFHGNNEKNPKNGYSKFPITPFRVRPNIVGNTPFCLPSVRCYLAEYGLISSQSRLICP